MKVLITGNKGFVGNETEKLFNKNSIQVIGYDLMDGKDIRDEDQLDYKVQTEKPDRILHLAATARFAEADKNPVLAFDNNAKGTYNVAKVADRYHIPVVYSSTGSVYMPIEQTPPITEEFKARGNSVYGCSKYLGECYLRQFNNPWIILRYGHLYGAEKRFHGLIGGYVSRIQRGLQPTLYGGKQSNDFAYVKDVAQANLKAITASYDKYYQVYNIGTGEEITTEGAGQMVCDVMGYKGEIKKVPIRTVDPERFVYDISKAHQMLDFKAKYSFKEGLKDMMKELK